MVMCVLAKLLHQHQTGADWCRLVDSESHLTVGQTVHAFGSAIRADLAVA